MKLSPPKGFTLVEVLIVVAILGILATLAIALPSRYMRQARQAEATSFLAAIATRQENHRAQFGVYRSASANPPGALPTSGDRMPWDKTQADWLRLGANPRKEVLYFQYTVVAGQNSTCLVQPACAGVTSQTWWYAQANNEDATVYINSANLEPWVVEHR